MSDTISFLQLLADLGGATLTLQRGDATIAAAVLTLPAGRQILAIERTYREGLYVILDPTPEELEIVRTGNLWDLWNSERAKDPWSVVGGESQGSGGQALTGSSGSSSNGTDNLTGPK
jgi:hypothetical protein